MFKPRNDVNKGKMNSALALTFLYFSACQGGVIYALTQNGELDWYKHNGYADGTASWKDLGSGFVCLIIILMTKTNKQSLTNLSSLSGVLNGNEQACPEF